MKLQAMTFGVATAIAFALVWTLCFIFVWALPALSMNLFADMMHSSDMNMQWHFGFSSFLIGLVAWSICGGFTAWLIAVFYNKLS
ncbi:DUF5676 family membrane protein [Kangiella koreensis]|uniref:Uncharacterized protein n=1 Tax=Kangiella koreensis (strain DSM 16069 / JCM 12317 / KCTC 12182 / SW-125) TaxID=523791 RepID=C7RAU0_KANKD|nr:DUF5676 family membrane protein [Kangiella koreensis]ACV26382.1 conserved hypothetical protein [Kangiella koreensis DSM 16069]